MRWRYRWSPPAARDCSTTSWTRSRRAAPTPCCVRRSSTTGTTRSARRRSACEPPGSRSGSSLGGVSAVSTDLRERIRRVPGMERLLPALEGLPPVYLVGGAVRDLLRRGESVDLDLVV